MKMLRLFRLNKYTLLSFARSASIEGTAVLKYTTEEQQKILDTINTANNEQLSSFGISQGRIKSLESAKIKNGPFKSLEEILEVNKLGKKFLEKLCENILHNNTTSKISKSRRGQFLMPPLLLSEISSLTSVIGLHLGAAGVSWAKINRLENKLQEWNFYNFKELSKKMLPTDTFKMVIDILNEVPTADYYIFEAMPNMSPQPAKQTSYNQQIELMSMLLVLLNTRTKSVSSNMDDDDLFTNRVHFLKANVTPRLFKTLMGMERVSSKNTVLNLLETSKTNSNVNTLYTTPRIDTNLEKHYLLQNSIIQEILGQALLLTISFMDLCVYKNPTSISAVSGGKKAFNKS